MLVVVVGVAVVDALLVLLVVEERLEFVPMLLDEGLDGLRPGSLIQLVIASFRHTGQ